ncbi:hypothetical protein G6F56_010558 [Rhizopus delemar]|nr:hypothetical protein G6F56_010558 [Rhizopus delemar]
MFAKSKRFPTADKDYIPGPGEYDVGAEDGNRHKRYGFLTQSGRFSEEHAEDDGYSTGTLSSEIVPKKEKSMQKEYEALVMKSKRMEATIEMLENEKRTLQLDKDMELADIRSKNAALQKTMNRQEKQMKANVWQKKVEQLESNYEKKLLEKEDQVTGLQRDLENKIVEIEGMQRAHEEQIRQYSRDISEAQDQNKALQMEAVQRQSELETSERLQHEQAEKIKEQQEMVCKLEDCLKQKNGTIEDLTQHLKREEKTTQQQQKKMELQRQIIGGLQSQFKQYRQYMNAVASEQHNPCRIHVKELNQLLTELHQAKKFINEQAIHVNNLKSDVYRLNSRCKQAEQSLSDMHQDRLEQSRFYQIYNQEDSNACSYLGQTCNETEHLQSKSKYL